MFLWKKHSQIIGLQKLFCLQPNVSLENLDEVLFPLTCKVSLVTGSIKCQDTEKSVLGNIIQGAVVGFTSEKPCDRLTQYYCNASRAGQ